MNITNEKQSEQVQIVCIEICQEDYAEKVLSALKKQRRTTQVPGFRPGNAPMQMIKRMYEKSFIAEEVNRMMYDELNKYIHENKISILGEPLPVEEKTIVDFEHPDKFVFSFEIASQKDFNIDYMQLPAITSYHIVATDEEIDNMILDMQKRHGKYSSPETISADDFVTVEYGENQNGNFYVNDLNKDGQNLFIGKNTNEVVTADVNEIFVSDVKLAAFLKTTGNMLDKTTPHTLEMKVKYIGHLEPAALDEEFYKKAYPEGDVKDEQGLRKDVAEKIAKEYAQHTKQKFMNDAIELLVDNVKIELPEAFLKKYILYAQKDNAEMTEEKLKEEYPNYEKSFKWQLLENKITKENNISVTEDSVKEYIRDFYMKNYFANFKAEDIAERLDTLVKETMKNKDSVKQIYDQIFDEQIGNVLAKNMQTIDKKVTFKEFADALTGKTEKKKSTKSPAKKVAKEAEPATEKKPTKPQKSTKKESQATKE